ncbi:M56 family metallopeptidase [Flavobacterium pectinovorum]|uniref:M56 family metallopeptidase n=1 Tax=Flavobacterium pectinovorum TaxID=29533 RepID=A0A502EIW1_9FLAO|nr:M56 family metallopeptidase [Flavobacterium pectinovorum]TPG37645.1 M56 family metallopeptidase [Flavobacterium pectinovorum]
MEALFIFIVKSSGLLLLFYCAYYFLLRKETFFNSNRWFLLAGLITSIVLPFLVYTKIVWIDPTPMPISTMDYSRAYIPHIIEQKSFEINWNYVVLAIYSIGFLALIIKFALDFYSLNSVLKGKKVHQQADFKFIDVSENIAPFSYFDYIVYNSSMYTALELENIIEHEKVHSDQNHTMDVLISRVFCVLFWFNPIIWLYKKAILQNLEFIADYEAAKKISDKKAYQYTLLKITTHESCVAITNHFYQSLIKKRIVMLNKNQSKKWNYWKYYAIIPALVAFVLLFQIKTIAQEKNQPQEISKTNDSDDIYNINKNTTDQEIKVIAEKLKKNHGADVAVSNIKRNAKNELIGIKINIKKGTEEVQTIQIDGDEAIDSFAISVSTEKNGVKKIGIVTDTESDKSTDYQSRVAEIENYNDSDRMAPPVPPTPPATPELQPAPIAPVMPVLPKDLELPAPPNMSNMPKPPVLPRNTKDKVAMENFDKKMAEFQKKMDAFQPKLDVYQNQVEDIMSKRELVYDKEMEKYEIAMEKFGAEMDKYGAYVDQQFGGDFEKKMEQFEKDMKVYEQNMKAHEKNMKKVERDIKRI